MGKKSGTTKSGRVMNPADRERKKQRAQELKRNKKQRTQVRHAIVKSRDPDDLLEQLRRLDDQDLDPNSEFSKHVIAEKRAKCKAAYMQQLALYRQENDENQITRLENMFHEYENDRLRKEQQYQAIMFSNDMNLGEIPLPSGSMVPNAAMTPFMPPPPQPPVFKAAAEPKKEPRPTKSPPGPPCGVPPSFDCDEASVLRSRRVQFAKTAPAEAADTEDYDVDDDDMGPVVMPDSLMPAKPAFQPVRSMISAPLIPPSMAPPPPAMPPPFQRTFAEPPQRLFTSIVQQPPVPAPTPAVQQAPPTRTAPGEAVISAAPQMRNFKKETTRFVPAALQVRRPSNQPRQKPISRQPIGQAPSQRADAAGPSKNADETCEDFLREIADLL